MSDITLQNLTNIIKNIKEKKIDAQMILQVHDELVFEIAENKIKESIPLIKNIMEKTHLNYKDFIVPLTVDHGIGNDWGESH